MQSPLSRYSSGPSFETGLQLGARVVEEQQSRDDADARQQQQEQSAREQAQTSFRNQVALQALGYRQRAQQIKAQDTLTWRQGAWNNAVNGYLTNLQSEDSEMQKYLDPKQSWQWSPETIQAAQARRDEIRQKSSAITSATPSDWSTVSDPSALASQHMQPLTAPFTPAPSADAERIRELNAAKVQAQIDELRARTTKQGTAPQLDPVQQKLLQASLKNRKAFIDATRATYSTSPLQFTNDPDKNKIGTMVRPGQTGDGLTDDPNAPTQSAKTIGAMEAWAKSSGAFIQDLQNPTIAGDDVSTLVKSTIPKYNNLATFSDFHDWLNDLSKRDYSQQGGEQALSAYKRLRGLVLGEGVSGGLATDDDSSQPASQQSAPATTQDDTDSSVDSNAGGGE